MRFSSSVARLQAPSTPVAGAAREVYGAEVSSADPLTRYAVLGPLVVVRRDERIEPRSPKIRALLVDLLLHDGEVRSVDRLIDDLWGAEPPATAVGVLHNYISQLRKLLGPDVVRRAGHGYLLDLATGHLDRDRFVALIDDARTAWGKGEHDRVRAATEEALALWRGEPLDDVRGASWALAEIARLRELRTTAEELSLEARLALGRHREVVPELEVALAREPLRERLWWLLMSALYRSGRRADALHAYQRARRTLVDELGIEPGRELRDLEQAVLRQGADPPLTTTQRSAGPPQRPAVAGRSDELATVRQALERPSGLMLLSGDPGIGKTRLLEDAQDEHRGVAVVGRAYEAERGRPYGPWVDALRAAHLRDLPAELADGLAPLLPELAGSQIGLDDTTRLYDAVVALLLRPTETGRVLVVLDDLQWLDDRSVQLLHYVVRHLHDRVSFIGSVRPLELGGNPPCARMLESLRRAGMVRDVRLGPLPDSSIRELAGRVAPPTADLDAIVAACGGSPLLALEMAQALARGDDVFTRRVDALITDRLERLSPTALQMVPLLAAFGRSMGPRLLAASAGCELDDLVEPLTELEEHGVVVTTGGGAYDFSHDLVREAAYRGLSAVRRAAVHGRIATVLASYPDADDILAADAARHADAADDSPTCAQASLRAARRCLRLLAYDEAAAHVEVGRRHSRRLEPRSRVALDVQLVDVLVHPGLRLRDPGDLATDLTELCAIAQQLGLTDELTTALTLLSRVYHWAWGDIPRAAALMRRAVELTAPAGAPQAEPLLQGARCLAYLEIDMPRTRDLFEELAGLGVLAEASYQFHWGRGLVLAWAGDTIGARAALGEAVTLARARADHWPEFECLARLALLDLESGSDAAPVAAQLLPLAEKFGHGGSETAYAAAIRELARRADGGEAFDLRIDQLVRIDATFLVPDLLGLAGEARLRRGDLPGAATYGDRALGTASVVHRTSEVARAHALLACVAAREGRREEAIRHLEDLADTTDDAALSEHVRALRREAEGFINPVTEESQTWQ